MCARIIQNVDVHVLGRVYRVHTDNTDPQIPIRWNGPPRDRYALCRAEGGQREIASLRWGLVPSWARTDDFAPHNARAETASVKPTFRDAWRRRRAVLPVNGWYEWQGRERTPFLIRNADDAILHLAALWDRWIGPGGPVDGFTVLITEPRHEIAGIHHRQPAVLESANEIDDWLDAEAENRCLMALAAQPGTRPLRIHRVSEAVNNPRNDRQWVSEPALPPL
ncbi:MAG: SOS response-associated peptidase [Acidobacteria bacterium]|nr:SOS response-associated peptidase [Acidobacteriota bacterium]